MAGLGLHRGIPANILLAERSQVRRTVRELIAEELRLHDRAEGLDSMALAGLVRIDKRHINVELEAMIRGVVVTQVTSGRYRLEVAP